MDQFQFKTFNQKLDSIQSVIAQMQSLDQELSNTNLQNLKYFNTAYQIITQNVANQFQTNYFQSDTNMQNFDICFAKYYFNALNSFINLGKSDPAWQLLFENCSKNNLIKTQYLALGINAHVNNDLAFAIDDTKNNLVPETDYLKINQIIRDSIRQVFTSYKEIFILENIKNITLPLTSPLLSSIIPKWRLNAWQNSLSLAKGDKSRDHIKKEAYKMAKKITIYV